ncbi:MAG: hypothetical protein ABIA93_05210 [Candidatus Woesearchaeota archaeon]
MAFKHTLPAVVIAPLLSLFLFVFIQSLFPWNLIESVYILVSAVLMVTGVLVLIVFWKRYNQILIAIGLGLFLLGLQSLIVYFNLRNAEILLVLIGFALPVLSLSILAWQKKAIVGKVLLGLVVLGLLSWLVPFQIHGNSCIGSSILKDSFGVGWWSLAVAILLVAGCVLSVWTVWGWRAVAIFVVVGAVFSLFTFWYFGLFTPDRYLPSKCTISGGFSCTEYKISYLNGSGFLIARVQNNLGVDATVTGFNVTSFSGKSCNILAEKYSCEPCGDDLCGAGGFYLNGDSHWLNLTCGPIQKDMHIRYVLTMLYDTGVKQGTAGGEVSGRPE